MLFRKNIVLNLFLVSVWSTKTFSLENHKTYNALLPTNHEQDTNKNNSKINSANEEKPDPTQTVAGGMGKEHVAAPKYAVMPSGKTLPEGIFRLDLPYAYTFGNTGYGSNGKESRVGFELRRWMSGVILQYGISDRVSIGVGVPFTISNNMGINGSDVENNSELYKKYFNRAVDDIAKALVQTNVCGTSSVATCRDSILTGNQTIPANQTIILPTGESYVLKQNMSIRDQIRNLVVGSATPDSGVRGIGDIQVGFLASIINEKSPLRGVPIFFSAGLAMRVPTGEFNVPMALRPAGGDGMLVEGGGTFDGILRTNLDYVVVPGLYLSWQNQVEYSFTKRRLARSSMITPNSFNQADPNISVDAANHGDGVSNMMTFEKRGLRDFGFLQLAWGLGNVSEELKWLGLYVTQKYNISAQSYLNGKRIYAFPDQFFLNDSSMHPNLGREQFYSVAAGTKISGLPYLFPLEFTAEFEYMYYGKNLPVAPMNLLLVAHLYFK